MKKNISKMILIVVLLTLLGGTIYYLNWVASAGDGHLIASGTIEARDVAIAPEIPGRVTDIYIEEGDVVKAGDLIFRLDDSLLQAQREQTEAAITTAEAVLHKAQKNLELAQLQYEKALQSSRMANRSQRENAWEKQSPNEFDLPVWYFEKNEELAAAQARVDEAQREYLAEQDILKTLVSDSRYQTFLDAENRLIEARISLEVADDVLSRAQNQSDKVLRDAAQESFDKAKAELEAAQSEYDSLLTTQQAEDILEQRACVAVARERYYATLDYLYALQNGDEAIDVEIARLAVEQAQADVNQAEANLTQVQAQKTLIDLQLEKTCVYSPLDGVVLNKNLEAGEVVAAGISFITIGELDNLSIKVYLPEDQYGVINLGDQAKVYVDSFPNTTFDAVVVDIAEQAEYTPRNVQTSDGRKTTVFAVTLSVQDANHQLKPGMPADVDFGER